MVKRTAILPMVERGGVLDRASVLSRSSYAGISGKINFTYHRSYGTSSFPGYPVVSERAAV